MASLGGPWPPLFFMLLFICTEVRLNPMTCGPGMNSPGYTYPVGDITLEYGNDLNILCILRDDTYGENASSRMSFRHCNTTMPSDIYNSTAIKLHIAKHALTSSADYSCFIDNRMVCHNIVTVGTKPKPVEDFDCIGQNYENFTCTWTMPQNYVKTNYTLTYKPLLRPQRYSNSSKKKDPISTLNCPQIVYKDSKCSCTWSLSTEPQYRHAYEKFIFNLTANNTFGTRSMDTILNHFSRVIPNPPENLTAVAIGPHSVNLSWVIPVHVRDFAGGLNHRISYWINGINSWKTLPSMYSNGKISKATMEKVLVDLPYAHWLYDIRVSMKSGNATEERFWSANSSVHVLTESKLPDRPPRTEIGCFEWLEGRHIMIYWEKIHDYEENGQNFSYHIEVDGFPDIKPKKLSSSYARFENVENRNYTFKIWSKNIKGLSKDYSVIFVPGSRYTLKEPENFVKFDKGSGQYELEWSNTNTDVTNFTIFWCSDLRDRPYQCDGKLNWTIVDRHVNNMSLSFNESNLDSQEKDIFQLAISANGYRTSSGMMWAECTVIPGRGVKLRQAYVKDVGSTTMVVVWKLDCFKKGNLIGFNITYCPTMPFPQSSECITNTTKYTNVRDPRAETGTIRNLKPYTRYKLQVKPILNGSESQFSESMFNSTFEGEPTEPRNLRLWEVTNSSIRIKWQKPEQENGFIRYYNVTIANRTIKVPSDKKQDIYDVTLDNLTASINYTIKVEACTVNCSEATLIAATEVGRPNIIPKPLANWEKSLVMLKWAKPQPIEARIDYYQVWISVNNKEQYFVHGDDIVQNVTEPMYNISICDDSTKNLYVKIRGVNVLGDKALEGPWNERTDFPCFGDNSPQTLIIIACISAAIICSVILGYGAKRIWARILGMRNVPVKLPDGLAAVVENYQEKEKHSDEPLLSKNFPSQNRNPSGESSGCSSGHESVASSIESTGHLSASDSGTEQPRSPSLGETDTRDVALRQRVTKPTGKKSDYVIMPEIQPTWTSKQTPGYSIIGLMPSAKKPEPNPDFMVLSDLTSKPSYVPFAASLPTQSVNNEPITRSPTSGYVPYMPQESVPVKNTDYVMAGTPSKNAIMPTVPFLRKEDNSGYVKAPPLETAKPVLTRFQFPWEPQQAVEPPSSGYVVVGDPKPQNIDLDLQQSSKGYVPHNIKLQATKSLKED
ncbi:cytokine receptor domeless isoform X1 [Rhynchophorus ferrugineus]|uniref:cytokine receptor domeless isoform X1 n=1 Tax=Rhynchophorus ferrugineus TaxID=354439 RepID=UPI003FCDBC36